MYLPCRLLIKSVLFLSSSNETKLDIKKKERRKEEKKKNDSSSHIGDTSEEDILLPMEGKFYFILTFSS